MKILASVLAALLLVLSSCEDIPLALTVKEQVSEYKASTNPAAAPTFNPPANTYNTDQLITISSSTIGATLRYTTDGSVPTAQSQVYTGPVAISSPGGVINAIAVKAGFKDSSVGTAAYTIDYDAAATPQISPSTGTFSIDQSVSISSATTGAVIHYTLNGSEPTVSSPVYTGSISVAGHGTVTTVKALAVKDKMKNSGISSSTITISWPSVATPLMNPGSGTYSSDQQVSITTSTPNAVIHYTNDGSVPTAASPIYSTPLSVAGNGTTKTIQALAVKANMVDSAMGSATVIINYSQVSTVQFSKTPGTYDANQSIALTSGTPDASIYYTTDNSTPTVVSGTLYTTPIAVTGPSASVTIKAIAVKGGMSDSLLAAGSFTVQWLQAEKPSLTLSGGGTDLRAAITFTADTSVGLVSGTSGANIYYAVTPGTTGVTPVTLYGGNIGLTGSQASDEVRTITAFTRKAGMLDSDLVTIQVTVAYPVADAPTIGTGSASQGFSSDQAVPISSTLVGSTTYYVTGGSGVADPTTSSSVYVSGTTTIAVMGSQTGPQSLTVKAMTAKAGYKYSPVSTAVVTVTYPAVSPVVFSPSTTSWTAAISVSASSATSGLVQYYYTVNGSTPTTASPMVSPATPFSITTEGNTTVKILARKSGMTDAYGEITYNITYPRYSITYSGNGNTGGSVPTDTTQYLVGANFVASQGTGMIQNALVLSFWSTNAGFGGTIYTPGSTYPMPAANLTLYAHYYKLTYGSVSTLATGLSSPYGISADASGNIFVADVGTHSIKKVTAAGVVSVLAGDGTAGNANSSGTGPTGARFTSPYGLAVDKMGEALYVVDGPLVRKVLADGTVSTLVSSGTFTGLYSIALDTAQTNAYVLDILGPSQARISRIALSNGQVTTIVTSTSFIYPSGIAVMSTGDLIVSNSGVNTIVKVSQAGVITTLAGSATGGFLNGTGTAAQFSYPWGVAVDINDNVYVADDSNNRIRKITSDGVVSTLLGDGTATSDDGSLASATVTYPTTLTIDGGGNIYISGYYATTVRKIE